MPGAAIRVAAGSGLIIHESGAPVTPFMPYANGERARVKFTDNWTGRRGSPTT